MPRCSSSRNSLGAGSAVALLLLLVFVPLAFPPVAASETLILEIHDGTPWNPLYGVNDGFVVGNFIPDLYAYGGIIVIERIWFYHGGSDYADSGVPYEVQIAARHQHGPGSEDDEFFYEGGTERTTTCNFCWEEVVIGDPVGIGYLGGVIQIGVFFRPLGGPFASGTPRIWVDAWPDYEHAATMIEYTNSPIGYGNHWYFSDGGVGEIMIGMEISGDVVTPTKSMSFSALKSSY